MIDEVVILAGLWFFVSFLSIVTMQIIFKLIPARIKHLLKRRITGRQGFLR
jgi:hypothetical protein